ncbi:MAG: HlyD family type I secretion periplasmic adaptor subunit [Pseudomonadota bacterium]
MNEDFKRRLSTGKIAMRGYLVLALVVATFGAWSVRTEIAGAVVASGIVEAEGQRQAVQHIEGGVVGAVAVAVGDRVAQGDVLITLDDTFLNSERALLVQQITEIVARQTRLRAERDGQIALSVPEGPDAAIDPALFDQQLGGQITLFEARRSTRAGQAAALAEQIGQTEAEIEGLNAQLAAVADQVSLLGEALDAQSELLANGLTTGDRLRRVQIDTTRLNGQSGALVARIAGLRRQINEIELQKAKLGSDMREAAISELRDLSVSERELRERLRLIDVQLGRLDIRAPVSGVVHDFEPRLPGSVLSPAERIMDIVPDAGSAVISVEVNAIHVDEIRTGQAATIRLTALNQRITPELNATVTHVSADAFVNDRTGQLYYAVKLLPDPGTYKVTPPISLVPGMPVEALIKTAYRSPIDYILQPMTDYLRRAMREA